MHGERSVNDEEVRTDKLRKDTSHAITVFLAQNRILNGADDYTTHSHHFTHTFLFKRLGERTF